MDGRRDGELLDALEQVGDRGVPHPSELIRAAADVFAESHSLLLKCQRHPTYRRRTSVNDWPNGLQSSNTWSLTALMAYFVAAVAVDGFRDGLPRRERASGPGDRRHHGTQRPMRS